MSDRKKLWKHKFKTGKLSQRVTQCSTNFDEYEFVVLHELLSGVTPIEIASLEKITIEKSLRDHPELCLNTTTQTTRIGFAKWNAAEHAGSVKRNTYYARRKSGLSHEEALMPGSLRSRPHKASLVKIIGPDGEQMTQTAAASIMLVQPRSLARRLKLMRRRKPNLETVTLEELKLGLDRARSYWKSSNQFKHGTGVARRNAVLRKKLDDLAAEYERRRQELIAEASLIPDPE